MERRNPAVGSLVALGVSIRANDPFVLAAALGGPSLYWEQRAQDLLVIGFGTCVIEAGDAPELRAVLERVEAAELRLTDRGSGPLVAGPFFGGFAFDAERASDGWWEGFPTTRWTVPSLLLQVHEGRASLFAFEKLAGGERDLDGANLRCEQRLREAQVRVAEKASSSALQTDVASTELHRTPGERGAWDALMGRALKTIEQGGLQKVVLARTVDVERDAPWAPLEVLARSRMTNPQTTLFYFREPSGGGFLGSTPELLCELEGNRLSTEALASSAPLGDSTVLASADKERREHQSVIDSIRAALGPLSKEISVRREPKLLELSYVAHLRTPVEVVLREGVSAADVLLALHPTSAVGGTPRQEALAFLREHEGFARGWYAGAVGWMGKGRAHLNVALRSAVLRGNRARLFVGAGIVRGSTAEREWNETALKSRPMLSALGEGARV